VLRAGELRVIDRAARGAWRDLETKLRPFIARRVHAEIDVDDVVQDVFLRMQRGLAGLRDEHRFGAWVYQVARTAIVDYQRRAVKHRLTDGQAAQEEAPEITGDDRAAERELAGYVAPFVAMLQSPYREALTLAELEGLRQKQAADMIGISLSGMKSRIQRGRRQLRKALEDCCHIALDARGRVVSYEPRSDGRLPSGCCSCRSSMRIQQP
jgi:RNA polymerase sigma-70 factor (ECF subfamily)